jgi:nucleotide-binding universal stress UspA family protein
MYHLTTGERPFGNPTSVPGLRRRLYRDPIPPRSINPSCPRWLQEVILRCLEVDPAERYGSAAQLAFDLKDPSQILLTARAERGSRDSLIAVARRWFRSIDLEPRITKSVAQRLDSVPIVMAAVDVAVGTEALADSLRNVVRHTLEADKGARLSCVTVRKVPRVGMDMNIDEEGRNIHVQKLVELKHWARPLELPPERIAFHVLEGADPALTLVEYARTNHVDHIVIGARASSTIRRFLGSVSSQVVAEAPCTVTVVRIPHGSENAVAVDDMPLV